MPGRSSPRFVLVAGEASGDLLGAGLIESLRKRFPDALFAGVGGPRMIAAGFEAWHAADELAVMGLVEVLKHLPRLLGVRRDVAKRTLAFAPDVFIGIDAPDFNLGLEKRLKRSGIRTVHYVSPSIWAWRSKRARTIGASADRVLCLFPFEPEIYARHGVDAVFVGHPLADAFAIDPDRKAARDMLGLVHDAPVLALLPGSRLGEIRRLGADFAEAAWRLREALPSLEIVAPMANAAARAAFEEIVAERTGAGSREPGAGGQEGACAPGSGFITLIDGNAHAAMIASDAVLLASGTAALEAMLAKRPMAVAYKLAPLTHFIVTRLGLLETRRYSLPNVLAGRDVVPELMQDGCTPEALVRALLPRLRDRAAPAEPIEEFQRLHALLRRDASENAAAAIADLVPST